jgi:hypothetical protein
MPIVVNHTSEEKMSEETQEAPETKKAAKSSNKGNKFVGIDVGTSFVVSATEEGGKTKYSHVRSAFIGMPSETSTRKQLETMKKAYIDDGEKIYLVGDHAIGLGNIFSQEVHRPMKRGILTPGEREAIDVMRILIKEVLKDVAGPDTIVAYSSPADPVDGSFDTTFHKNLIKGILKNDVGVKLAVPKNEAHALGFSELADDGFTGLCFSFGAGMVNAVLSYSGIEALKFSIPNGGDWIDSNAAYALGITNSQAQSMKEKDGGVNIGSPETHEEMVFASYYEALVNQAIDSFNARFSSSKEKPQLDNPIPVVVAGGTSKAKGFIELFNSVVDEKGLPFEVKEIRHAEDPLRAVAQGLLLSAMNEE